MGGKEFLQQGTPVRASHASRGEEEFDSRSVLRGTHRGVSLLFGFEGKKAGVTINKSFRWEKLESNGEDGLQLKGSKTKG